tara:strand:+ start:492 stop:749 length:258 start_codon:yes stop_codon:yes gene_type:complete
MLRFYNLNPSDLDNLPVDEFEVYWQQITKLEAEEMLIGITVADYPYLKGDKRTRLHNRLKNIVSGDNNKLHSPADIANALKGLNG